MSVNTRFEDNTEGFNIVKEQKVDGIVEHNKELRKEHQYNGVNRIDGMIPVATLPFIVIEEWLVNTGFTFEDLMNDDDVQGEFNSWLNSEEALPWRTSNIKL